MLFTLLYPEARQVNEETIAGWYDDAVANGDLEPGDESVVEQALALHEAGLITLRT